MLSQVVGLLAQREGFLMVGLVFLLDLQPLVEIASLSQLQRLEVPVSTRWLDMSFELGGRIKSKKYRWSCY